MKRFILCLVILIFAAPAFAEDVTIAVLDLAGKGVPRIVSNAVSDIIRSEFVNIGNFTVVERSQMAAILEEQGLQMTGCTDSNCAVQFGKILSARRIIIGEVSKVAKKVVITVRYVDVQSGKSLFSASGTAPSVDEVDIEAKKVAKDLARRIVEGDKELITPITKAGYYGRGAVPGWGQIYAENSTSGYIMIGLFSAAALFTGYATYDYYAKKDAYESADPPQTEIDSKFSDWEKSYDMLLYSFVGIGAVYLYNWVDILFFSTPEFSSDKSAENFEAGDRFYCFDAYETGRDYTETRFKFTVGMRF